MTNNKDVYNVTYTMGGGYKSKTQEENEDLFFEALNRQRASEEKSKAAYLETQKANREKYEQGIKTFPDSVVTAVRKEMLSRAAMGFIKYNETLDRTDLSIIDYLQHAKEEAMDLALYLEKTIQMLKYKDGKI
jgi:hypothetical protein